MRRYINSFNIFQLALICAVIFGAGCVHQRAQTVLLNPSTNPYFFQSNLFKIKNTDDNIRTLKTIANDDQYPLINRRLAIMQWVHRLYKPGITLEYLSRNLDIPKWLKDEDVKESGVSKAMPIEVYLGESAFYIQLIPTGEDRPPTLWFRLSGNVTREEFSESLRKGQAAVRVHGVHILQIGSDEPCVSNWILFNTFGLDPDGISGQLRNLDKKR
jgi:hypothetical protein